jgi:hypothetical protein
MIRPSFTLESPERFAENARKQREKAESLPPGPARDAMLLDAAALQTLAETMRLLKALRTKSQPEA